MKRFAKKSVSFLLVVCFMLSMAMGITVAEDRQTYIDSKLKDAVVLSVGCPNAMIGLQKTKIDKQNNFVVPVVEKGSTLVPVRFVSEALGAKVDWDEKTKTVTLSMAGTKIEFIIGQSKMTINGEEIELPVAPKVDNSRTLVPLRAISEGFDKQVFYDRGLIIISDIKDIFDPKTESDILDEIIMEKLSSLPSVDSYENYLAILSKLDEQRRLVASRDRSDVVADAPAPAPAPGSGAGMEDSNATADIVGDSKTAGPDYSSTNVQVEGVDEADVIKTDGTYIYKVRRDKISIVKAVPPQEMSLVSEVKFNLQNYYPQDIYVDGNRLVVIGSYWKKEEGGGAAPEPMPRLAADTAIARPYPYRSSSFARVDIYDISNIYNPVPVRHAELEGNYLSSRKIGNSLYFVTNYYTYNYDQDPQTPPDGVQPLYRDTAAGGEYEALDFRCIMYLPGFTQTSYLNVAGLDIVDVGRPMHVESYLGGGSNLYVSRQNMYVAMLAYEVVEDSDNITYNDNGKAASSAVVRYDYTKPATKVFKFAIQDGQIQYVATGQVEGNILNQFSMDEYNGDFRIATTTWERNSQYNNLFVLDSEMKPKGKITNIAPGERIYSTRFMGDKAYMVTFRQVDPLFVIDLADPSNPTILGQLKIPGYSDYLHPYDETHIIGFGMDTDADGRTLGMKIAIFDVSDFANPKQMHAEYIGDRGTSSPLLYNHKALLFSKERNLLAFPVSLYEIPQSQRDNKDAYGMFAYQGLYVYDISLESGFSLRGRISHITDEELKKFGNVIEGSSAIVERGLYINDTLYTVSEFGIMANDLYTLGQQGFVQY